MHLRALVLKPNVRAALTHSRALAAYNSDDEHDLADVSAIHQAPSNVLYSSMAVLEALDDLRADGGVLDRTDKLMTALGDPLTQTQVEAVLLEAGVAAPDVGTVIQRMNQMLAEARWESCC